MIWFLFPNQNQRLIMNWNYANLFCDFEWISSGIARGFFYGAHKNCHDKLSLGIFWHELFTWEIYWHDKNLFFNKTFRP